LLLGRLLTYDALEMRFAEFRFERRNECAVCGAQPTITKPQDPPELCVVPTAISADRMSATELKSLLTKADAQAIALIDVREPYEFAAGHLAQAVNIPLSSLQAQWSDVPAANRVVFICRSGARSAQACELARELGMQHASNVEGGMLAWAKDVDNTMLVA
jgi:rhodanese-related sulfurtransferase